MHQDETPARPCASGAQPLVLGAEQLTRRQTLGSPGPGRPRHGAPNTPSLTTERRAPGRPGQTPRAPHQPCRIQLVTKALGEPGHPRWRVGVLTPDPQSVGVLGGEAGMGRMVLLRGLGDGAAVCPGQAGLPPLTVPAPRTHQGPRPWGLRPQEVRLQLGRTVGSGIPHWAVASWAPAPVWEVGLRSGAGGMALLPLSTLRACARRHTNPWGGRPRGTVPPQGPAGVGANHGPEWGSTCCGQEGRPAIGILPSQALLSPLRPCSLRGPRPWQLGDRRLPSLASSAMWLGDQRPRVRILCPCGLSTYLS